MIVETLFVVYLSIAFGVYLGALVVNIKSYKNLTLVGFIRGIIGCLVWPILITLIFYYGIKGLK